MAIHQYLFWVLSALVALKPQTLHGYQVDGNPYRHVEILDKDGRYQLEWLVNWEETRVYFNVTANTRGYVGFGLSRKGKMLGADIVIGGVLPNGQPYFSDRHAIGNQLPVEDTSQDWQLHEAWETGSHTFLSFSRKFETCDEDHDLIIDNDSMALLWAFGEKDDDIEYHYQNRGVAFAYLLDPDLTPMELEKSAGSMSDGEALDQIGDWNVWRIPGQYIIPEKDTTYLCSIHKVPSFNRKQHAVGFRAILPTEVDKRHIHHFLLLRCTLPPGQNNDRMFQRLLGHREECYMLGNPSGIIPTQHCSEIFYPFAVGQKPTFLPDHIGMPLYPNEYYLLQMHFDNPMRIPNLLVNYSMELFYTETLRENDGGVLTLSELVPSSPSIIVPPNSLAHDIYGHCSAECTKSIIPPEGIRGFAVFPHTHLAGRAVRLFHFRNNQELAPIISDDNYNFNYQQIRILREERLILPGDQLFVNCVYENTDQEGNATIGGFSTRQEMCSAPIWYYNRIPNRPNCRSDLRAKEYRDFIQIYNTTWSDSRVEHVVNSPRSNAGLLVSEVASFKIDWTIANRERLQEYHRTLPQVSICTPAVMEQESQVRIRNLQQPPTILQRFTPPPPPQRRVTTLSLRSYVKERPSPLNLQRQSMRINTQRKDDGMNSDYEFPSEFPWNARRYQRPTDCPVAKQVKFKP